MAAHEDAEPVSAGESKDAAFFIAGVGTSAGGLEALTALLEHATLERLALVVVQHLAPTHDSMLTGLLAKVARVPVQVAEDGTKVEPAHVYVIPPNADLALLDGVLQVIAPPQQPGPRLPVDFFLRSLADDQGDRAIGIIMSGTGSDGTLGLRAIKEAGGITFVQDPASAKYDGMPRHALSIGPVDGCLAAEGIARELNGLAKHPHRGRLRRPRSDERADIGKVLLLIRSSFGTDFTLYKPSSIERRIARRMAAQNVESVSEYARLLQANPAELSVLYKDVLIGVTRFFRDVAPFEALKTLVLPRIMDTKAIGGSIRIWVPACSTGEEAYSIVICLLEYLGDRAQDYSIQVFGTDIDEDSINQARRGVYPQGIEADVSPERLRRFFVKKDSDYQVSRQVRDRIVFSVQNLAKDAPFSRLDLISCRNLLIYLQPPLQRRVLHTLHYALNPGSFLLLGCSETVGDSPDLFSLVDRKSKIYTAKSVSAALLGNGIETRSQVSGRDAPPARPPSPSLNVAALADRKVLELYGPPGVVVSESLDVLHFRGRTGPYLEPAAGAASLNVLRLARPELHVALRKVVQQAQASNTPASVESTFNENGRTRRVKIDALRMSEPGSQPSVLLVLFHELPAPVLEPVIVHDAQGQPASPADRRMREMERELSATKEYLQSTIEEVESANEELQSANEELQSANEELQSTNEELETSKEELQSANEELTTVNDELQTRMLEQQQTNDDLHNVLTGVDNAVVIVGLDLRIRRFTVAAERLFNLVSTDIGRSITLLSAFVGRKLDELATGVIDSLVPVNEDIVCADQRWRTLRISPYKTAERSIRGAVFMFVDIDTRKRALQLERDIETYAATFLSAIGYPLMVIDGKNRVLWANSEYYARFQVVAEETVGSVFPQHGDGRTVNREFSHELGDALTKGPPFRDVLIRYRATDVPEATLKVSASRMPSVSGDPMLTLLAFEDVSMLSKGH